MSTLPQPDERMGECPNCRHDWHGQNPCWEVDGVRQDRCTCARSMPVPPQPEGRKHNCRTDGCDPGHDTPPLAGPQKPPRCRLDVEYGGWGRD